MSRMVGVGVAKSYPREVAQGRRPPVPWEGPIDQNFGVKCRRRGEGMYKLMGREVGGG